MPRSPQRTDSLKAAAGRAWMLLVRVLTILAFIVSGIAAVGNMAILAGVIFALALVATLAVFVVHYRRRKNSYAQHLMTIADAGRFLAASAQDLEAGASGKSRRVLERLLEAFRTVHETVPGNPASGWRVALWAPESPDKLRIIASLDISRKTEQEYVMGSAPGCIDGLAWKAWAQKTSLTANDAAKDPRVDHDLYPRTQNPDGKAQIGCLHCQVFCLNEDVMGVISIDHPELDLFRNEEEDARASISSLVALAMWKK